MRYWVSTLESSGFVSGSGSHGSRIPENCAPLSDPSQFTLGGSLEISQAQYNQVAAAGYTHTDGGSYRWQIVNNVLTELTDDRFLLQVDIPDPEVLTTENLVGTVRVLNPDRSVLTSFNGTRTIYLRHDGNGRGYRVNFSNGERAFSKQFAVPGRYEVISDGSFAIDRQGGVTFFDIIEAL